MVAYSAVHAPRVPDPARLRRFADQPDGPRRELAAVLAAADDGLGAIDDALQRAGVAADTLTFFTSDNGAAGPGPGGLRGGKSTLYEGGVRVPLLIRWPGHLPADARYGGVVSTLDVFTTALAAATGRPVAAAPTLDGADLVPYASGARAGPPHDALFWRVGDQHAMRDSRWKLYWRDDEPAALYDLVDDPGEANDLAGQRPEQVEAMRGRYARWEEPLAAPRWEWVPGQIGAPRRDPTRAGP